MFRRRFVPIVRIRNLGDNGIDWEVKYWLEDYTKYNDTDALIRQRIWYAFQRENIHFAYPDADALHRKTNVLNRIFAETVNEIFDRLSDVPLFAPLNGRRNADKLAETRRSQLLFAPGEKIVRQRTERQIDVRHSSRLGQGANQRRRQNQTLRN